jgi:hypothetical protein
MMSAASLLYRLLADVIAYARLLQQSSSSQVAEILFLRKQLALYQERNAPRNPIDPATRITMALLSNRFHWRDALAKAQPNTTSYRIGAWFSCADRQYPNIDKHGAPLH